MFCLAGAGGHGSLFTQLAGLLDTRGGVYAIQARGLEGGGRPDLSMAAMLDRTMTLITETAPDGPLVLVGHSLGGLQATEIGTRLTEQGRDVIMVAVLDSVLPDPAVPAASRRERVIVPPVGAGTGRSLWRTRGMVARVALGHSYPIGVHKQIHYELAARMSKRYRPVRYAGPAVVVSSHENTDRPEWWDPILPQRDMITLPCDHLGMLKPSYVQQTATMINARMTR